MMGQIAAGSSSRPFVGRARDLEAPEHNIANIYLKTDTDGRARVTAYALQRGLG
jgi:hypothetical protein